MSYIIYTSSGTILTTVATGKINTATTSIALIGRDVNNYGRYINQNLVDMLSNFSTNSIPPNNPLQGQLWYDATYGVLKVFDNDTGFTPVNSPTISTSQPIGQVPGEFWYNPTNASLNSIGQVPGEFWYNPTNASLNFLDDTGQYRSLTSFPMYDVSGWQPSLTTIVDQSSNAKNVTLLKSYGDVIGAITTSSFVANTATSTSTFVNAGTSSFAIAAGLTIIGDIKATGNLHVGHTTGTPTNSSTPASWLKVDVGGSNYYLPLYQ